VFERFNDQARQVIALAAEEARMLNHNSVRTEDLLLAIVHEGEGAAAQSLATFGVQLPQLRRRVEEIVGIGREMPTAHIPYAPDAKKVLELSLREAQELGHNYVGSEHLLLGLISEGEGLAIQILQQMGIDLNGLREQVIELFAEAGLAAAEGSTVVERRGVRVGIAPDEPACPRCRTPLLYALGMRTLDASGDEEEGVAAVRLAYCRFCGATIGVIPQDALLVGADDTWPPPGASRTTEKDRDVWSLVRRTCLSERPAEMRTDAEVQEILSKYDPQELVWRLLFVLAALMYGERKHLEDVDGLSADEATEYVRGELTPWDEQTRDELVRSGELRRKIERPRT